MKFDTSQHFAAFRIVFGIYLSVHFIALLPYTTELWSAQGAIADTSLNFTHGIFPNLLEYFDRPLFVTLFMSVLIGLSLLFTLGVKRQIVALILWYGWACLFNRNNLISNPGIPYVGWLLLACSIIPTGEGLCVFGKKGSEWNMPYIIFIGAWLIMAAGYTISGIEKLGSPSWVNGSALKYLLENPLARDWWTRTALLSLPEGVLQGFTWIILLTEIIFLPCLLFINTRLIAWVVMVVIHLGILVCVDFADLTCGMLMIHLFTFDVRWLHSTSELENPQLIALGFKF